MLLKGTPNSKLSIEVNRQGEIFRKDIFCNVYTSDLTNLNLQKNKKYNILFIESCNCKFEKILINIFQKLKLYLIQVISIGEMEEIHICGIQYLYLVFN